MSNRVRPRTVKVRQRPSPPAGSVGGIPIWVPFLIVGLVVLVLVIGFVAASEQDDEATGDLAFGQVDYIGDRLPPQAADGAADPAVGMTAASVRGFDPEGVEQRFENGEPRAIVFVAHWCPRCQAELDDINAWLAGGGSFPEGVEIQTIATWTDPARDNYPPGRWLADNDWNHRLIVDSEDFYLAENFGLGGTPMWIFVDADGTIVERVGSIAPEEIAARLAAIAA